MSKVDQDTKPDWKIAKEGLVLCDNSCFSCKCCNHDWSDKATLESSWGHIFSEDGQVEYVVYQLQDPMPLCFEFFLFPCMFISFALIACTNAPMGKALVVGYDKRKNETFACIREKGYISGWDSSSRREISELSVAQPQGLIFKHTEISIYSSDSRPPLKVQALGGERRFPDIEGFVKECNKMLSKSRGEGKLQEAVVSGITEPAIATAMPYSERDSIELSQAMPVPSAPQKIDEMRRDDPTNKRNY